MSAKLLPTLKSKMADGGCFFLSLYRLNSCYISICGIFWPNDLPWTCHILRSALGWFLSRFKSVDLSVPE